ncbi:MAG: flagellar motor protein MotB [Desulfobacteraceae bacterium 4572_35.1]|nr:MAG: flagellar motor protein MotB [Desulfobacteraceae bacterium 4572_35.1]
MAKKEKKGEEAGGAPAWMVTYSDLVTLLLTFFVLLLSMANMDQVKFSAAAGSLRGAFGVFGGKDEREISPPSLVELTPAHDDLVQRLYSRIMVQMNRLRLDPSIKLVKDRGAVILRINESVLFSPGTSKLKPAALPVLAKVASLVEPLPLQLRIEGHTDDLPFTSKDMSNWDLSVARSVAVLKFFQQSDLFPLDRMSAVGYGAEHPLVPNDTAENRAKNRRVEFVLESLGNYREDLPYLIDANEQLPF